MATWKVEFPCIDLNYDQERLITYYDGKSNTESAAIRKTVEWLPPHLELAGNPVATKFTPIRWHNNIRQVEGFVPRPTAPPRRSVEPNEPPPVMSKVIFDRLFGGGS